MDYVGHARSNGRKSSGLRSQHGRASPTTDSFDDKRTLRPRPTTRLTPSELSSSAHRSNGSSSRSSRTSSMMMSLFGRRNSRRERSFENSPSLRYIPVSEDIILSPSIFSYSHNNTGWENSSPTSHELDSTQTSNSSGQLRGAPYALSNVPAHFYLLQPQQSVPAILSGGSKKENRPALFGHTATPTAAVPPYLIPSYCAYPPQGVIQWPELGGSAPTTQVPVPTQKRSNEKQAVGNSAPKNSLKSKTMECPRSRSPQSDADFYAGRLEERKEVRGHRRSRRHSSQRSCESPEIESSRHSHHRTSHRHSRRHERNQRHSSPDRPERHQSQSLPQKARVHICNGCGRVRSRKFHDANPVRPGKKPIANFCRKCRSLFEIEHDD